MRVTCAMVAAMATAVVLAGAPASARQKGPQTKVFADCLAESRPNPGSSDIVSKPITTLFLNGAPTPVNEILCVAKFTSEEFGPGWFRLDPAAPSLNGYIGLGFGGGSGEVNQLEPSPDGKFLAVAYSAEGHPWIEIVDLPALMRDKRYSPLGVIGSGNIGDVAIERWESGSLTVTSDVFLTGPHTQLPDTERFSWDPRNGELKPLSDALRDPLRYFAAGLGASHWQNRMIAVWGLLALNDAAAVPFLEQALAIESNESVKTEIRDALDKRGKATALLDVCLSADPETLAQKGVVTETIRTLSIGGRKQIVDETICVINLADDSWSDQRWFRVNRASQPQTRISIAAGNYAKLTGLQVSLNGKFLAAQYGPDRGSVDGAFVEIVDLARLMRENEYRLVHKIEGFHGSVSIRQWNDDALDVTADIFLNHPLVVVDNRKGDPISLPLLSPQTFSWRSETGKIVPTSSALEDPGLYYCAGLKAPTIDNRRIAVRGLALLKDRSTLPCLTQALSDETNRDMQGEIRQAIEQIRSAPSR